MQTNQIVGLALLFVGILDAVLGAVVSSRAVDERQRRILRIAFATSAAIALAAGVVFLIRPPR